MDRTIKNRQKACPGCGALFEDLPGKPHAYIGASMGCWQVYGEVLAREYSDFRLMQHTHRRTVDTYAIQHPGVEERRSIQSVNLHLLSLYVVLEKGWTGQAATKLLQRAAGKSEHFLWLNPPSPNGGLTVVEVRGAPAFEAHRVAVQAWAENLWTAWADHHEAIRGLAVQLI